MEQLTEVSAEGIVGRIRYVNYAESQKRNSYCITGDERG